jgi:hypothetical protein
MRFGSEGDRRPSEFSYKANASVDGAPIFASRGVMHFPSYAHGFCTTVAGRLTFSTGILALSCAGLLPGPLQPYAFFATGCCIS